MGPTVTPAQIAATRRLIGLTAEQLGAQLGINPRTIRGWEAGKYSPSETAAQALVALREAHDAELHTMLSAAPNGPTEIPTGPKDRSWYLALAARLMDRQPTAQIDWDPDDRSK